MSKKTYENIIIKNDKFSEDTMVSLALVKKYVCEKKLLIVGGMAIDFALKLKGMKLYDDDVLPDYDFYSPEYHIDAYKIAEKLKKAGLSNISVINANHTSTMRVRVNYTVVADVTYMPKNIYDKLPFLVYRGVRIIHPYYQLIDQHRSLSYPYENPPWEVITHRWKKDATRHDLLYEYYNLKPKNLVAVDKIELKQPITVSAIMFNNQCISGFAGLLYWEFMAKKLGYKNINIPIGTIHVDGSGFIFEIPNDSHGVSIYSDDIIHLLKGLSEKNEITEERQYNRFLDKLPHKFILNNTYEVFDNKGYMLSAHKTSIDIYIANLQNIMVYMLTNLILLRDIGETDRGYSFYIGYITAHSIVKWAGDSFKKKKSNIYFKFLPSIEVYGSTNVSDSYLNSKRLFLEKLNERVVKNTQPKLIFPDTFEHGKIPNKYYTFNPKKSSILQFDGIETKKYYDRTLI